MAIRITEVIQSQNYAESLAIKHGSLEVSYEELFERVTEVRSKICERINGERIGGARIGVSFPNGLGYILVALAVLDSDACFVPIPDELSTLERERLIRETALQAVIHTCSDGDQDGFELPLNVGKAKIEVYENNSPSFSEEEFQKLNPAFIRFSSGTTAHSKGVIISHESLLERIEAANEALKIDKGDRILWILPMAHHFAVSIILYLYRGACTVIETSHQPDRVYQAAKETGTKLLYGSPFHFAQFAQYKDGKPLPKLKMAVATAAKLSEGVAHAFEEKYGLPLTHALGIIEVGLPVVNLENSRDFPTAIGKVLSSYEWKIRPLDIEDEVKRFGELLIRGKGMFDAYLLPWRLRRDVFVDGWFETGDLVEEVQPDTLILRGRSKSVINVGGMKVFPEEIESVLNEHESISYSRAFAGNHPTLGTFPQAEFLLTDGESEPTYVELASFCKERLSKYKIPVRIIRVDSIPITASGKVKRYISTHET